MATCRLRWLALTKERDFLSAAHLKWLDTTGQIKLPGRMYEVNIGAKPEQFLDWDRPLAPDHIARSRLKELSDMGLAAHDYGVDRNFAKDAYIAANNPSLSGEGAYRSMIRGIEAARPKLKEAGNPRALFGDPGAMAAEDLKAQGVPGIRYLDQGSRFGDGSGTSNYVVFDPGIIDILRKYALPGMVGGGAAAGSFGSLIPQGD